MKFAYLVCFVALLQISRCQDDTESSTVTLQSTTLTDIVNLLNSSEPESNETSEMASTSDSNTTTTMDDEVPDTISYNPEKSETTTGVTTEESSKMVEEVSTTTKPTGRGVLVYPTALIVALVPLCIRLVSINLVSVV